MTKTGTEIERNVYREKWIVGDIDRHKQIGIERDGWTSTERQR